MYLIDKINPLLHRTDKDHAFLKHLSVRFSFTQYFTGFSQTTKESALLNF